ncbi:hypothetical protein CR513_33141, partial [Mucuna pruriens]
MRNIIVACCILHTSLIGVDNDNSLLVEVDYELFHPTRKTWRWFEEMDHLILSVMVNEAQKGLEVDGSWVLKAYTLITKRFEANDKGVNSLTIHHALNNDNETINLNDTCDDSNMDDLDMKLFDDIQASISNVESFSSIFVQYNYSNGTSSSRGTKHKVLMVDVIKAWMDKLTTSLD